MQRLSLDKRTTQRVLVGTVTDNEKSFIREKFIHSINSLTYPHDFKLIDTSNWWHIPTDIETITEGRNQLRNYFLQGNYDYFLAVDSDVIIPIDTIEKLMAHDKDIVSFKIHFTKNGVQVPAAWKYRFEIGVKGFTWEELEKPQLLKVWGGSLAIALIKRKVLIEIEFRYPIIERGEDYWFMRDIENKFEWWLDTSIRVEHYN